MRRHPELIVLPTALAVIASGALAADYTLEWSAISSGSVMNATGGGFELSATIGQPAAGAIMTGGGYTLVGGFWAGVGFGFPGDCNDDGAIDLTDYAAMADCLDGPAQSAGATGCTCFDLDNDDDIDLADFATFQAAFAVLEFNQIPGGRM